MEDLLNKQEWTSGLIARTIINLKKLGRDNITRGAVRARLEQLENYWNKLQENHDSLICLKDPTFQQTPYFKENYFDKAAENYATVKGELLDMLFEFETTTPNANSTNTEDVSITAGGHHNMLPRINVPRFSGNYTDWTSFSDLFTSLVHNNTSLSDVQRLHYLKLSLTSEAEQLLKNLEVTSANYKIAWDQLVARYENKRLIIYAHLQNLTKLPAVKSESASDLKRLYDGTTEVIRALENLKRPINHWDDWLVHITVDRLDIDSRRDWEKSISSSTDPVKYKQLKEFIEGRIRELEALESSTTRGKTTIPKEAQLSRCKTHTTTTTDEQKCQDCSGKHFIMFCSSFRKKTPEQRRELIFQKQLCYNCLSNRHLRRNCVSVKRCQSCGANHHSMLHGSSIATTLNQTTDSTEQASTSAMTSIIKCYEQNTAVLLATAVVNLRSADGRTLTVRALLDQGSESSFITESVAQQLRLKRKPANITVYGLGNATSGTVKTIAFVQMHSQIDPDKSYEVRALVLPKLTTLLPTIQCSNKNWAHLQGLQFADPDFNKPAHIELVLGADVYSQILLDGVRTGSHNSPVAQRTTLGWILSGVVPTASSQSTTCSLHCITNTELSTQLQRFWQVEDVAAGFAQLTDEEIKCETHFTNTHTRDDQGRYVVRLPFKTEQTHFVLSDSYQPALQLLLHMERRFMKNPELAASYVDFMTEYSSLGHMAPISNAITTTKESGFVLPHHSVTKTVSSTTKLRVVFNASQPSLNGSSLNESLLIGPKLQPDLSAIILRWRMHPIVFGADIAKMYRQIWVHPEDCDYQRILWRADSNQPIQQYRLLTVTYGTACAPFLALRVLRQLAHDEQHQFPLGAQIILHDMYIDDVLTGANSIPEAIEYQRQLTGIMEAGGFHLRKWVSNSPTLLEKIPQNEKEPLVEVEVKSETGAVPVLGLFWQPQLDNFKFRVQLSEDSSITTKRVILSDIARLFDPLGWLSPVTITAKILLQSLWLLGVDWDTDLPTEVEKQWKMYRSQLPALERISFRRWTGIQSTNRTTYELHGFADASERAYAAAVYLRVRTDHDNAEITLLSAKTKVAPVKRISLPRLELCAATLLARLTRSVQQTLDNSIETTYLWTDSTVVLAWIKGHASRWKTFVANRVSEIQTIQSTATWRHVSSTENPADCASRGFYPVELENHSLWWNGPQWLTKP